MPKEPSKAQLKALETIFNECLKHEMGECNKCPLQWFCSNPVWEWGFEVKE